MGQLKQVMQAARLPKASPFYFEAFKTMAIGAKDILVNPVSRIVPFSSML
jgi:hypothetical protein